MKKNENIKRIAASLRYGKFDGGNRIFDWVCYVCLDIILLAAVIGISIAICLKSIEQSDAPEELASGLLVLFGTVVAVDMLFFFIFFSVESHRSKLLMWLDDAVELEAYSKNIGEIEGSWLPPSPSMCKIRVFLDLKVKSYGAIAK